ncbi:hypothetical protein ACGFJ7_27765 [Actinoplanes sp. NPDC048988]|uniref:hypothetical protein n=1 Tax=Actinoplanes sp. NPDC048988 TaxID=3363901 RepID=UPI0037207F72
MRIILALVGLQLFESDRFLPGHRVSRPQLVYCANDDWWDFLYTMRDDFCGSHGASASLRARPGTDVSGPCRRCGQPMTLTAYNPDLHGRDHLICLECRTEQPHG